MEYLSIKTRDRDFTVRAEVYKRLKADWKSICAEGEPVMSGDTIINLLYNGLMDSEEAVVISCIEFIKEWIIIDHS